MVYILGTVGFIGGFIFGQMLLFFLLRNVKKEDLLNDPYIKWKYGVLNWICAGLGAYSFVAVYGRFFS